MQAFRTYHLAFAAAVIIAWFSAEELGLVHAWTGYAVAALIVLRLLLGAAKARGFEVRRLLPRAAAPAGQTGLRHPAIGGLFTLALLLCVTTVAGTGIAMDWGGTLVGQSIRADDEDHERGGNGSGREQNEEAVAPSTILGLAPPARADDDGEEEEGVLGEVHETAGNLLIPLVAAHVVWLLLFRFQLARFMLFVPRRRAT